MKREEPLFESLLTRREALAGAVYITIHFALLPLLFDVLSRQYAWFTVGRVNLIYYALAVVFLGAFMMKWLYRQYEHFVSNGILCIGSIAGGYLLYYILSGLLILLLSWFEIELGEVPNDSAIMELQGFDARVVKAVSLFLAPVLEETLMRGVVFGTLRRSNRQAAYVVSVMLFSYCHVWPYAPEGAAFWLALVQYVPVSLALCRSYERCGSIWAPVTLHMFINAMGYSLMSA
ncbi:MAG: CPBP family intramembrane metalloprotease [Ruminococcaceae bacterium]|nr:CPBP family intramembrane metalloprotease [Oscillospiraceae bacterium]